MCSPAQELCKNLAQVAVPPRAYSFCGCRCPPLPALLLLLNHRQPLLRGAALEAADAEDARTPLTWKMPFTGQWAVLRPVELKAALHIASSNNLPASASPWISQLREKLLPWLLVPW